MPQRNMNLPANEETFLLLERAQSGESVAFDGLVTRYFAFVQRIVRPLASRPSEIEDLVQETFISAFLHLSQLQNLHRFEPWLAAVARSTALMNQRRRAVQLQLLSIDEDTPQIQASLDAVAQQTALACAQAEAMRVSVYEALARLPLTQRHAVRLHYLEGYNYRETAQLLQIPETAIRGRLDRARTELRKELAHMNPMTTLSIAATLAGTGALNAQELPLSPRDLHALRSAATFAQTGDSPLNSVLLTRKGELVSTDSHRLFVYQSEDWEGGIDMTFAAETLRKLHSQTPPLASARLFLNGKYSELRFDGSNLALKPLESSFPNWKKVVPTSFILKASAPLSAWKNEVEGLIAFWKGGPSSPTDEVPKVTLSFWPDEKRVTLELSQFQPTLSQPSRSMTVTIPVDIAPESKPVTLGCNAIYLLDALQTFDVAEDTEIEMGFNGPLSAFVLRPVPLRNPFVVLMPMQLSNPEPQPSP